MSIDMRASLIPLLAASLSAASSTVFAAAPIASPDTASTRSGIAVSIPVMANDRDPDGNTFTIGSFPKTGAAKHGTVVRQGANAVYKPAAGFAGTDSFTYRLRDSTNAWSTAARVTVTVVAAPNTPPVARADSATTTAPDAVTFNLLANDTDADRDVLTVTANSSPANGTVTRSGGMATYTPAAGFSGTNSFNYRVSDGKGGTASATVTITVAPKPNTPPVAGADSASTTSPDAVTVNLLTNDTDEDGDTLSVTAHTAPANGTVTRTGGSATYTPAAGFSGTDSFGYSLADGKGGTATGTVTVAVAPKPNTAPVATADSANTTSPNAVTVNLLTNDTDEDGDTLSVTANTAPANGSVTISGGSATYTPVAGFSGTDAFGYTVSDGKGGSATGAVTITVAPKPNTPPVADADSASTTSPNAVTVNLLANDTDDDGDTLSVTANTAPANGSVTISGGSATYTPAAGFSGSDGFSYTVSDGKGGTSSGTVTLTVEAAPAPAVISGSAILNWSVPTTRSNGAPLSMAEIAGYEIYLLAESTGVTSVIALDDGSLTSYTIDGLSADTYHFSMAAKDSDGNLSALSAVVSKVIGP